MFVLFRVAKVLGPGLFRLALGFLFSLRVFSFALFSTSALVWYQVVECKVFFFPFSTLHLLGIQPLESLLLRRGLVPTSVL